MSKLASLLYEVRRINAGIERLTNRAVMICYHLERIDQAVEELLRLAKGETKNEIQRSDSQTDQAQIPR